MTAPTVVVTVNLADLIGVAVAGATVKAKLDQADAYSGTIIPAGLTGAITDVNGTATLNLFPNALQDAAIPGLGTTGSSYNITITAAGEKTARFVAVVPNQDCTLDSIVINDSIVSQPSNAGNAIRFDLAQSLTSPQQATARANVGFDTAVQAIPLTGLSAASSADVTAVDTSLSAFGKLQGKATQLATSVGSSLVGASQTAPVAVPYLQTVSDINNGSRVSAFRFIPAAQHSAIRDFSSAYDCLAGFQTAALAATSLFLPFGRYCTSDATTLSLGGADWEGEGYGTEIRTTHASNNVFTVSSEFARLSKIRIDSSVVRSGGWYVDVTSAANRFRMFNFHMDGAFGGIRSNAVATCTVEGGQIFNCIAGTGVAIRIDSGNDVSIRDIVADNPSQIYAGVLITAAGDVVLTDLNMIHCGESLYLNPAAGQVIASVYATNGFFDTSTRGLLAQADGGAIIRGTFTQCWFGSAAAQGALLKTTAGGTINGLDFVGCQGFLNTLDALRIDDTGVTNVRVVGGAYAGNGGAALSVGANVSEWSAVGARMGNSHGFAGNLYAVFVEAGTGNNYEIVGNDLRGNITANLSNNATGTTKSQFGNLGATDVVVTETGTQTLTNKTATDLVVNGLTGNGAIINFGGAQFYKDVSGNVGLGTSSPGAMLHLSNGSASLRFGLTASNQFTDILRDTGTGETWYNAAQAGFGAHVFKIAGVEKFRIANGGAVTVGTWNADVIAGQYGGTGVANTGKTITLGGNLSTAGAFASTFTMTGVTGVTFPTSGTLATVSGALGTPTSIVLTNATGTASGLTAGNVTTNANLTGEVTSVGNATTLTNAAAIGKVLTGYVSGAGAVAATDTILQAIQKLNGNDATNANLTGDVTSVGNATTIKPSVSLTTPVIGAATGTSLSMTGGVTSLNATAPPASGANTAFFVKASSTANLGVYFGSGAPTFSAAQGSLYVNTAAATTITRLYVNTTGSTTWATFTASA